MKNFAKIVAILGLVILVGSFTQLTKKAWAAGNLGYIDVQRVFSEYKETQKAKDKIAKEEENFKKEFEKRQKEIETARNDKKMKESDINDLIAKKSKELEPLREKVSQLNQELIGKIQKEIVSATEEVAKKLGIDVVLDKQVFITGGLDLTEKVLYRLNQTK
jgi:Skp family chaperone for outer membrane proteins